MKAFPKILLLLVLALVGCQQKPTRLYRHHKADIQSLVDASLEPIVLKKGVVLVDSRKPFDYSIFHIPGSVNLGWEEFTQPRGPSPGLLKTDYESSARRLARLGINPQSDVVIVGYGQRGNGEEGRLAWTLYYLGVKKVRFADIGYFKTKMTQNPSKPLEPASPWKPEIQQELNVDLDRVLEVAGTDELRQKTLFVDVRPSRNYQTEKINGHIVKSINIHWREFLTPGGRPNLSLKEKLQAIGLGQDQMIIVIGEKGVGSATATMALLSMGYAKASHFSGGWRQIKKFRK